MAEVVSGEAVVLDVPVAQFPSRILALIIDIAVQLAVLSVLSAIIFGTQAHLNQAALIAASLGAVMLVIIGYPCIFETLSRGRSLGKLALGLRVVSDDGGPERFRQAFFRALMSLFEIWALSGSPALICSMLSAKGKRAGDWFAGTFVLQERLPRRPWLPPWLAVVPPPLAGWAQTLELSALQDITAEQASSYLRRFSEFTPAARDRLGQQIAAALAAQVTPPPPPGTPPVPFLSAVLAVRRNREMWRLAAQRGWPAPPSPAPFVPGQYPAAQPAPYPGPQPAPYPGPQPAPYPGPQPTPYPGPQPTPYPGPQPTPYPGEGQPGNGGFAPPA